MLVLLAILAATSGSAGPAATPSSNREFLARNYPRPSLERGEQGPVGFEVTVEPDGFMSACVIKTSSGFPELDRGTCEFLARYGKMRPVIDAEGRAARAIHEGRINWRLPPRSGRRAVATLAAAPAPLEMQCRRFTKTGTKSRKVKVCMTESEWAFQDQELQTELTRNLGVNR